MEGLGHTVCRFRIWPCNTGLPTIYARMDMTISAFISSSQVLSISIYSLDRKAGLNPNPKPGGRKANFRPKVKPFELGKNFKQKSESQF